MKSLFCSKCHQPLPYTDEELRQSKIQNALNSQIKARARGTKLGRPKVRDDEIIKSLYADGHSIRTIAVMTGVSSSAVQRGLKS
jgi:DNA invertase Pin-like site-specific DNA recombinase